MHFFCIRIIKTATYCCSFYSSRAEKRQSIFSGCKLQKGLLLCPDASAHIRRDHSAQYLSSKNLSRSSVQSVETLCRFSEMSIAEYAGRHSSVFPPGFLTIDYILSYFPHMRSSASVVSFLLFLFAHSIHIAEPIACAQRHLDGTWLHGRRSACSRDTACIMPFMSWSITSFVIRSREPTDVGSDTSSSGTSSFLSSASADASALESLCTKDFSLRRPYSQLVRSTAVAPGLIASASASPNTLCVPYTPIGDGLAVSGIGESA